MNQLMKKFFKLLEERKGSVPFLGMSIPHVRITFLSLAKVIMPEPFEEFEDEDPDLACIICLYPEEFFVNTITSSEDDPTSTIQPGMLGKTTGLWTIKPSFVVTLAK